MKLNLIGARAVVSVVALSLVLPACDTAKLQKTYSSFDVCFREEKTTAMVIGGLAGGVLGVAVAGGSKQGAAVGAIMAVVGAIVGQKIAWQQCLKAFPPKVKTVLVEPPKNLPTPATTATNPTPQERRFLKVNRVVAEPMTFGRDLELSAEYALGVDVPNAKDIKATVHRKLLFVTPDGNPQEISSSSEDTIQPGTSKTTFAIPIPSLQDAAELAQTRNWAFKLIVEAEGMRTEVVVPLKVPELPPDAQSPAAKATPVAESPRSVSSTVEPQRLAQPVAGDAELLPLAKSTKLFASPGSQRVVARTKADESVKVLQRKVIKGATWIQVQISKGAKGWVKGE